LFGVVLVNGDGLDAKGVLTESTKKKLETAVAIYKQGNAAELLVTSYNSDKEDSGQSPEAGAMTQFALDKGIRNGDVRY
jgi:vancomycin permeability regulator SanA